MHINHSLDGGCYWKRKRGDPVGEKEVSECAFDEVSAIRGWVINPRRGRAKPQTPPAAKSKADFESRSSRLTCQVMYIFLISFLSDSYSRNSTADQARSTQSSSIPWK